MLLPAEHKSSCLTEDGELRFWPVRLGTGGRSGLSSIHSCVEGSLSMAISQHKWEWLVFTWEIPLNPIIQDGQETKALLYQLLLNWDTCTVFKNCKIPNLSCLCRCLSLTHTCTPSSGNRDILGSGLKAIVGILRVSSCYIFCIMTWCSYFSPWHS